MEGPKFTLISKGYEYKKRLKPGQIQQTLSVEELQQLLLCLFIKQADLGFKSEWFNLTNAHKASKIAVIIQEQDSIVGEDILKLFDIVLKFENINDWTTRLMCVKLSSRQVKNLPISKSDIIERPNELEDEKLYGKKPKRKDLLLSISQMLVEGYLLPYPLSNVTETTLPEYEHVTNHSPMYAIDCEMCLTEADANELTRFSMVDEKCNIVYDTYVKPNNPIKDYLTKFSGITKEILDPVKTKLSDVQAQIRKLLPKDAILVGQSLNFDLQALELFHPYCIDTSVIYNNGTSRIAKTSLKNLIKQHFSESIQEDQSGHCSIEDAIAAMKLVKLKLEKGINYGDTLLDHSKANHNPEVSFSKYVELKKGEVKVFYDYLRSDVTDRFLSLLSKPFNNFKTVIREIIGTKKSICVVISHKGFVYIKVT